MLQVHPFGDLHLKCVLHWDRNCSCGSPCMVCAIWSEDQWTAVDAVVAREEANTILKASGRTAHSNGNFLPLMCRRTSRGRARRPRKRNLIKFLWIIFSMIPPMQWSKFSLLPEVARTTEEKRGATVCQKEYAGRVHVTRGESPLTLLHSLLFSTTSLAAHVRGTPPGFAAPLTRGSA